MSAEVIMRPMEKRDVKRVAELERICFRSPWSEKSIAGELKNDVAHYRVVEYNDTVIGYAGMWVMYDEAHITNVAIAPEYRRMGLGRALMRHMMKTALIFDATSMTLEVREGNIPAQTLYYSLGFTKVGVRKRYYTDSGEDAYILWNTAIKDYAE